MARNSSSIAKGEGRDVTFTCSTWYTMLKCLIIKIGNSDTAAKLHRALLPPFAHYIGLVLAAHTGQKDLRVKSK